MSIINNFNNNDDALAIFVPGIGAVLPNGDENTELIVPFDEIVELSAITQTPMEEIFKPIDFPYWSL